MRCDNWASCTDPDEILVEIEGAASERKLRLACCACARRVWYRFDISEVPRLAIQLAEEFADGLRTHKELVMFSKVADDAIRLTSNLKDKNAFRAAAWCVNGTIDPLSVARSAIWSAAYASQNATDAERSAQAELLRDVCGNSLQTVVIDPAWCTLTVKAIAETAYTGRILPSGEIDASSLAGLAEALEVAGCTDSQILSHCRDGRSHVRGCWVIDLILGKN